MQNNVQEEEAQRAANRLVRALISMVEAFDRNQNGGEQKFPVANGHPLEKISKRPKRSADPATGTVQQSDIHQSDIHQSDIHQSDIHQSDIHQSDIHQSDINRIHQAATSNTREKHLIRFMEPMKDGEPAGATVDIETSDGLKFQTFRTSRSAHVMVDEQYAVRVMAKYGSSDPDFVIPLIREIARLGIKGINCDTDTIKLGLSFVRSIRPGDVIEALLGYHLAVVNEALSFNFSRLNEAQFMQYNDEQENADRAVNWSARTFIALEEAFHRHQNGREQKLTVRHMTAPNGHGLAKTSTKPKRGIRNVNTSMNGAANDMERHSEVLLSENQGDE
jgi:hypothetical protein